MSITDLKYRVHFGATLTVGEFMIAEPLSHFLAAHPDSDLSVTVANTELLLQKLDAGEIDFAILEGNYPRHLYRHVPYVNERFIPICGERHVFKKTPRSLLDLTSERLLVRESGSGTRRILEDALAEYDLGIENFQHITTIGNMNTIKDMVQNSCGITFLYETAVKEDLKTARSAGSLFPAGISAMKSLSFGRRITYLKRLSLGLSKSFSMCDLHTCTEKVLKFQSLFTIFSYFKHRIITNFIYTIIVQEIEHKSFS